MGLLDIFRRKSGASALSKHAARVANKRAQAADRWESIHALGELKSPEAVAALLERFTYRVDPSITDQEEKEAALQGIVAAGEAAIEPVRASLREADAIAWPLKILARLVPEATITDDLLALLASMDTEYERDPQRKIQVLIELEDRRDPRIAEAVTRFLDDVNETVRFHAVGALVRQEQAGDEARVRLSRLFLEDESMRVRARIADGFIERGWGLAGERTALLARMPSGYSLDKGEKPRRG